MSVVSDCDGLMGLYSDLIVRVAGALLVLAGSLWHEGAYDRAFPCMEANYDVALSDNSCSFMEIDKYCKYPLYKIRKI